MAASKPLAKSRKPRVNPVPKAMMGRPTKYRPEMCMEIIKLSRDEGRVLTKAQVGKHLKVCRQVIWEWEGAHKDFANALKMVKDYSLANYDTLLMDLAKGDIQGNATAAIFLGKNQFPKEYRDRHEHFVETTKPVIINFLGFDEDYDESVVSEQ